MTRKHFRAIAAIIKDIKDPRERARVAEEMANLCASTNENFSRSQFYEACDVV